MAAHDREKFATQVDAEILRSVREIARSEGRQLQALVDEALSDLVEKRKAELPCGHVMAAYRASHGKFAALYKNWPNERISDGLGSAGDSRRRRPDILTSPRC
jgi:protein-disulfide isomerase-like protein with CxxC motif